MKKQEQAEHSPTPCQYDKPAREVQIFMRGASPLQLFAHKDTGKAVLDAAAGLNKA